MHVDSTIGAFLKRTLRAARPVSNTVVVSFPKSGRTWLRFMLDAAGVRLDYVHAGAEHRDAKLLRELRGEPERWSRKRILFLYRDPRDTAVSGYFQAVHRLKTRYAGDFHAFLRDPRHGIEKIAGFNLMWLEAHATFPGFAAISYEMLHGDPAGGVARAIRFVTGATPDPAVIATAVDAGRFDAMRTVELALGSKRAARLGGGDPSNPESFKTRRGVVGGWHDYFDAADTAFAEEVLARTDYQARTAALQQAIDAACGGAPAGLQLPRVMR